MPSVYNNPEISLNKGNSTGVQHNSRTDLPPFISHHNALFGVVNALGQKSRVPFTPGKTYALCAPYRHTYVPLYHDPCHLDYLGVRKISAVYT